jgi:predicted dehydrogenase
MSSSLASRRRFLRDSTGLLALAPTVIASRSPASPPSERIVMGFIGMGKQSRGLLDKFLAEPSVHVAAVCDVDPNRRLAEKGRVDRKYRNTDCRAYVDFRDITSRDDIDAVCIATPDHWHAIQTVAALEAGKDVYCEKPLTHNIDEAVAVMKAVERHRRVLQTGSQQRSSREFWTAAMLVRNGVIGRVTKAAVNFGPPGVPCDLGAEPVEPGLDWDLWLGPAPERPYHSVLSPRGVHDHFPNWRQYREFGGGMVTDWGAHHLDIIQWGLDQDDGGPVAVLPPGGESVTGARLVYPGNVSVIHGEGVGVHFFGTEGEVQVSRGVFDLRLGGASVAGRLDRNDRTKDLNAELERAEKTYLKDAKVHLARSMAHVTDFLDAVRARRRPVAHEGVGGRTAIACHLLNLGYYHRRNLQWDPARFAFTGGTGQPEWRTRAYRGGWKV